MEFTTESNAEVTINMADFIESSRLRVAVMGAIKASNIEISKLDIDQLFSGIRGDIGGAVKSGALDSLIDLVMSLDINEKVSNEIFNCLKRSTYNNEKITRSTFNSEGARGDYYHIVIMCLKVNVLPFYQSLFSKLNGLQLMKSQNNPK